MSFAPNGDLVGLAQNFKDRLRASVSDVIPVSGLLGMLAQLSSDDAFDRLAFLGSHSEELELQRLLKTEPRFEDGERQGISLSLKERRSLFLDLRTSLLGEYADRAAGTWEMIRFVTDFAQRKDLKSGAELRKAVWRASNIELLRNTLESRFFAISDLIQSASVLKKAADPCRVAIYSLRDEIDHRKVVVRKGTEALSGAFQTDLAKNFIAACIPMIEREIEPLECTLRELHNLVDTAESDSRILLDDIAALRLLSERRDLIPASLEIQTRALLGQYGFERTTRLGLEPGAACDLQFDMAMNLHKTFCDFRSGSRFFRHIDMRITSIIDDIELIIK